MSDLNHLYKIYKRVDLKLLVVFLYAPVAECVIKCRI